MDEAKKKILGMISHKSDLLLFDRAISYHPRAEVWLLKVEYCAQETIGKLIGSAVGSFPKQPLDEWIIDYPQQTILSTIHLILTHEINEMLHEMRAARKSEDPTISHSGPTDTVGLINESSNINTRSMQQLQETSRMTSQADDHLDYREEPENKIPEESQQEQEEQAPEEGQGEGEEEKDTQQKQEDLKKKETEDKEDNKEESKGKKEESKNKNEESKDKIEDSKDKKEAGGRLLIVRRQEEEAKSKLIEAKLKEEKNHYILDMFGSDFEITRLQDGTTDYDSLKFNEFKDEAMRALQDKSFQGLYLRLQFWINQMFKRLQGKTEGCNFKLYKTHILVMKTII